LGSREGEKGGGERRGRGLEGEGAKGGKGEVPVQTQAKEEIKRTIPRKGWIKAQIRTSLGELRHPNIYSLSESEKVIMRKMEEERLEWERRRGEGGGEGAWEGGEGAEEREEGIVMDLGYWIANDSLQYAQNKKCESKSSMSRNKVILKNTQMRGEVRYKSERGRERRKKRERRKRAKKKW
jgi:hypothetical protein